MKRYLLLAPIALIFAVAGCGNINDPTALAEGSLFVNFSDGTAFASSGAHVSDDGSKYTIYATDDQHDAHYQDEITLTIPKGANIPYSVGSLTDAVVQVTYYENATGNNYAGNMSEGSCNITLNSVSSTNAQGTFVARTVCSSVTDSVRTFSGGEFNATF